MSTTVTPIPCTLLPGDGSGPGFTAATRAVPDALAVPATRTPGLGGPPGTREFARAVSARP